ncbi:glucose 1-dehydrogenase [Halospeciosus flavus]|uniref:Glucose 1-dehydrogenase n=1 Tax=Halospeciosus flavus TaxID=3032283 RepID=A0ABD5Z5F3_9EURY|nr:glucose 1-dehydrogenase [Halospeciosus flavus]
MKAIAVTREERDLRVVEKPRPEPDAGEALVEVLRVGVDGTDHEVIRGGHGGFPEGEDHMVLGHEAVGVVADANGTDLEEGQVVVPTVRRPPNGTNEYFERGEPDMAPPGEYVERGIEGGHGFMAEYVTSPAEYLVAIPEELAELGFLVEPASISEKAFELAEAARSSFEWTPESAFVLGNGSLGLLTLAMLDDAGYDDLYCAGRRSRPDPTINVVDALDATYVNTEETAVADFADAYDPADFVYEATGYARHAFDSVRALAPNGVAALLGVPGGEWDVEVDAAAYHREVVLENKAVVGSVNSGVEHFEDGAETLQSLPEWLFDDLVTGVYGLDEFEKAFVDDETTIKTAVEFTTYEER